MSRVQVPLLEKKLWATGDILLRAELEILLKDNSGTWATEIFRVDSGSEMTTMPAYRAAQLGLSMPSTATQGAIHSQTGLEIRSGFLRVKIAGMDQTEYIFPCFFLGDPKSPPDPKVSAATLPRNLIGLSGVVNQIRILFDGDPSPGALYGNLIVEKK